VKTITIEVEDDEVLIALKRPEGYEDVHPEIVAEDAGIHVDFEGRVVWPKEWP
jgi:hypothetical protein